MREESGTRWQRRGSSIVFDPETLSPLLIGQSLISLRTFLGWLEDWPDDPPGDSKTILVGGLEPCLELYTPEEAETFLRYRVRPVVEEFQTRWDQRGLVFGFGKPARAFQLDPTSDEMTYIRQDRKVICLAYSLWNGGAAMDLTQIVRPTNKGNDVIGYYVPRLS